MPTSEHKKEPINKPAILQKMATRIRSSTISELHDPSALADDLFFMVQDYVVKQCIEKMREVQDAK